MLELEIRTGQQVIEASFAEDKMVVVVKEHVDAFWGQLNTSKAEIDNWVVAVDKMVQTSGRAPAVRGELLASLDCLEECQIQGCRKFYDSLRGAAENLWRQMVSVLEVEAMRMHDRPVCL